jgi:hypothetical protein
LSVTENGWIGCAYGSARLPWFLVIILASESEWIGTVILSEFLRECLCCQRWESAVWQNFLRVTLAPMCWLKIDHFPDFGHANSLWLVLSHTHTLTNKQTAHMNRNNLSHSVLNWNKMLSFLQGTKSRPTRCYAFCEFPIWTYEILARFSRNLVCKLHSLIPPQTHNLQFHSFGNNNNNNNNMADANTFEVEGRIYNPYLDQKLIQVLLLGYGKPRSDNSDSTRRNPALDLFIVHTCNSAIDSFVSFV